MKRCCLFFPLLLVSLGCAEFDEVYYEYPVAYEVIRQENPCSPIPASSGTLAASPASAPPSPILQTGGSLPSQSREPELLQPK